MKTSAKIRLRFASEQQAKMVRDSIKPETTGLSSHRSKTTIHKEDDCLLLNVEAQDTVALRASLNAYLRWIHSVLDVFEAVQTQEPSR